MKHELFEELEAFDPKWQTHYATVRAAAIRAGVYELFLQWLDTPEGNAYRYEVGKVPDYAAAIKAAQEAAERLPFNIGD